MHLRRNFYDLRCLSVSVVGVLQLLRPLGIFFYLLQNRRFPKKIKNTKLKKKKDLGVAQRLFLSRIWYLSDFLPLDGVM